MTQTVIAGDFGGTNLRAALVGDTGEVLVRHEVSTHPDASPEAVLERIAELLTHVRNAGSEPPVAASLAVAGLIDAEGGRVMVSPNIPAFRNLALTEPLSERLGIPVSIENDASAAALGEYRFGAGQGHAPPPPRHPRDRHRRRPCHRRTALPGRAGTRGGDRPHHARPHRTTLRLRRARLPRGDRRRRRLRTPGAAPRRVGRRAHPRRDRSRPPRHRRRPRRGGAGEAKHPPSPKSATAVTPSASAWAASSTSSTPTSSPSPAASSAWATSSSTRSAPPWPPSPTAPPPAPPSAPAPSAKTRACWGRPQSPSRGRRRLIGV